MINTNADLGQSLLTAGVLLALTPVPMETLSLQLTPRSCPRSRTPIQKLHRAIPSSMLPPSPWASQKASWETVKWVI